MNVEQAKKFYGEKLERGGWSWIDLDSGEVKFPVFIFPKKENEVDISAQEPNVRFAKVRWDGQKWVEDKSDS
ncbi:MAG: hypothetical protein F2529_02325 [Actinobacteria bacterium]|uniref:Unannotated protein n=1 Tax=freshwater metagenome TaxID=449393 RepID=A0A6J6GSY5_9ZZZZ|nr:hypothetical protein [Rhodoluna sp.]MSZ94890.1 hypothetical protein [Actinomycetota bacterium]MTA29727.1 hypothetical protein [Actinomycetota bacterium]